MIGRRGFLQGVVASLATSAVVIEASPEEIQKFGGTVGQSVQSSLLTSDPKTLMGYGLAGEFVFNHLGQPIGVIKSVTVTNQLQETTLRGDSHQSYSPTGLKYGEYVVVSVGPVNVLSR